MTGATVEAQALPIDTDDQQFTVTLTEAQRVAALLLSGTDGGDSSAVVLDLDANALADMGTVTINEDDGNSVDETEDTTLPQVLSATFDYNDPIRQLVVYASETIKVSTVVVEDLVYINDVSGQTKGSRNPDSGTVDVTADATQFTIRISEDQRVDFLKKSGVPGGDSSANILDVEPNMFTDMANKNNDVDLGNDIDEIPDRSYVALLRQCRTGVNRERSTLDARFVTGFATGS